MNSTDTLPSPANKTPLDTKFLVTHIDAHLDEAFAMIVSKWHGKGLLPGVDNATYKFVGRNPSLTEEQCHRAGLILYGCGLGRFDDHSIIGRKPDSSTTKLVLEYLEVTDPVTRMIGHEVHWCDVNLGVSSTQLANLVKSFHRHRPANTALMLKWVEEAFDALKQHLGMPFVGEGTEFSALMYFQGLRQVGWYKEKACNTARIQRLLEASMANAKMSTVDRTYYTELDSIVRSMQRIGKTHKQVYEWVTTAFECMTKDEILFGQALEELREGVKVKRNLYTAPIKVPNGDRDYLRVCMLHTQNPMALSAARTGNQEIIIIRNDRNQVNIFNNTKTFNLNVVVGMMRWMDSPPAMREAFSFQEMCTTNGSMACAPHLHYNQASGQLLNGTPTHPDVLATALPSQAIIDMVTHAFHPSLVSKWMYEHGVRRRKPVTQ